MQLMATVCYARYCDFDIPAAIDGVLATPGGRERDRRMCWYQVHSAKEVYWRALWQMCAHALQSALAEWACKREG